MKVLAPTRRISPALSLLDGLGSSPLAEWPPWLQRDTGGLSNVPYRLLCPVISGPHDFSPFPSPNTCAALWTDCPVAFAELLDRGGKYFSIGAVWFSLPCELPQLLGAKTASSAAVSVLLVRPVSPSGTGAGAGESSHIKQGRSQRQLDRAACLLPAGTQAGWGLGLGSLGKMIPYDR